MFTRKVLQISSEDIHISNGNLCHRLKLVQPSGYERKNYLKIRPYYSTYSTGTPTKIDEKLYLECLEAKGRFLHTHMENGKGLYLSSTKSVFEFKLHYRPPVLKESSSIRAGLLLQFYGCKLNCNIVAEGSHFFQKENKNVITEDVHCKKCKAQIGSLRSQSSSAITYWQLEKVDDPLSGDNISLGESFRIKHLQTQYYLAVTGEEVTLMQAENSEWEKQTAFQLTSSVLEDKSSVKENSFVQIKHLGTNHYLVPSESKEHKPKDFTAIKNEELKRLLNKRRPKRLFKLDLCENPDFDDAFLLDLVADNNQSIVYDVTGVMQQHRERQTSLEICDDSNAIKKLLIGNQSAKFAKRVQKVLRTLGFIEIQIKNECFDESHFKLYKAFLKTLSPKNRRYMLYQLTRIKGFFSDDQSSILHVRKEFLELLAETVNGDLGATVWIVNEKKINLIQKFKSIEKDELIVVEGGETIEAFNERYSKECEQLKPKIQLFTCICQFSGSIEAAKFVIVDYIDIAKIAHCALHHKEFADLLSAIIDCTQPQHKFVPSYQNKKPKLYYSEDTKEALTSVEEQCRLLISQGSDESQRQQTLLERMKQMNVKEDLNIDLLTSQFKLLLKVLRCGFIEPGGFTKPDGIISMVGEVMEKLQFQKKDLSAHELYLLLSAVDIMTYLLHMCCKHDEDGTIIIQAKIKRVLIEWCEYKDLDLKRKSLTLLRLVSNDSLPKVESYSRNTVKLKHLLSLLVPSEEETEELCSMLTSDLKNKYEYEIYFDVLDYLWRCKNLQLHPTLGVVNSCLKFLSVFAKDSNEVKKVLLCRLDLFLDTTFHTAENLPMLLQSLFMGGNEICLKVHERQIEQIFEIAGNSTNHHIKVELLKALKSLTLVEDFEMPLKRNQEMVLRYLQVHLKEDLTIICQESDACKLLANDDLQNTVLAIADLLASCAVEGNSEMLSVCKTVFTLEQICKVLLDETKLLKEKKPFVLLLTWVHGNSNQAKTEEIIKSLLEKLSAGGEDDCAFFKEALLPLMNTYYLYCKQKEDSTSRPGLNLSPFNEYLKKQIQYIDSDAAVFQMYFNVMANQLLMNKDEEFRKKLVGKWGQNTAGGANRAALLARASVDECACVCSPTTMQLSAPSLSLNDDNFNLTTSFDDLNSESLFDYLKVEFERAFLDGFEPKAGEHEQEERNNLYLCCMEYLHENVENVEEVFKIGLETTMWTLAHPSDNITEAALKLLKVMLKKINDSEGRNNLFVLLKKQFENDKGMDIFVETTKERLEQANIAYRASTLFLKVYDERHKRTKSLCRKLVKKPPEETKKPSESDGAVSIPMEPKQTQKPSESDGEVSVAMQPVETDQQSNKDKKLDVFLKLEHSGHVKLALQVLELLCRKQSVHIQNYMRTVPCSIRQQNVVGGVARFSKQFYRRIENKPLLEFEAIQLDVLSKEDQLKWRKEHQELIFYTLKALTKFCVGNKKNKATTLNQGGVSLVNSALHCDEDKDKNHRNALLQSSEGKIEEFIALQLIGTALEFLHAVLEETESDVIRSEGQLQLVKAKLEVEDLKNTMQTLYEAAEKIEGFDLWWKTRRLNRSSEAIFTEFNCKGKISLVYPERVLAMAALFRAYQVLVMLKLNTSEETQSKSEAVEFCEKHFKEIQLEYKSQDETEARLCTVHFPLHPSVNIREEVREELIWNVNRNTDEDKLQDLLRWFQPVKDDMKHQAKYTTYSLSRWFHSDNNVAAVILPKLPGILLLIITIVLNIIMLSTYKSPSSELPIHNQTNSAAEGNGSLSGEPSWFTTYGIHVLGTLHLLLCITVTAQYIFLYWPHFISISLFLNLVKKWILRLNFGYGLSDLAEPHLPYLSVFIINGKVIYLSILLLSSVGSCIINFTGPFYGYLYSLSLLHIVYMSDRLKAVLSSITKSTFQLILIGLLAFIILFIYSIAAFALFPASFTGEGAYCSSLRECFVTMTYYGFSGSITDNIPLIPNTYETLRSRMFFDISFFLIWTIIGLNIVLGIIVNNFIQDNDKKLQIEKDFKGQCFICHIPRHFFEGNHAKKRVDFISTHISKEHCKWSYIYYSYYLDFVPCSNQSAIEKYVYDQIKDNKTDFFPSKRLYMKAETSTSHAK